MVNGHSLNSNKHSGFSLLELIIVLVIIGVLVAAITMSISDTRGDNLRLEARRLAARLSLARDEAVLSNQEYGLLLTKEGYQFLVLKDDLWQPIDSIGDRQLIKQDLPERMELLLNVEGLFAEFQQQGNFNKMFREYDELLDADDEADSGTDDNFESDEELSDEDKTAKLLRPQIYMMTSGEINPFTLLIGYEDQSPIYYQVKATFEGKLDIEGPFHDSMNFALQAIE